MLTMMLMMSIAMMVIVGVDVDNVDDYVYSDDGNGW